MIAIRIDEDQQYDTRWDRDGRLTATVDLDEICSATYNVRELKALAAALHRAGIATKNAAVRLERLANRPRDRMTNVSEYRQHTPRLPYEWRKYLKTVTRRTEPYEDPPTSLNAMGDLFRAKFVEPLEDQMNRPSMLTDLIDGVSPDEHLRKMSRYEEVAAGLHPFGYTEPESEEDVARSPFYSPPW